MLSVWNVPPRRQSTDRRLRTGDVMNIKRIEELNKIIDDLVEAGECLLYDIDHVNDSQPSRNGYPKLTAAIQKAKARFS